VRAIRIEAWRVKQIVLALAVIAGSARADTLPDIRRARTAENDDRPVLVADLGLGSAIGYAGLAYTQPLPAWFRVELGAGFGATGNQVAGMLGYAWYAGVHPGGPFGDVHVVIGSAAGVSISLPRNMDQGGTDEWLDVDGAVFILRTGRLVMHAAAGATMEVHGDARYCPFIAEQCYPEELKAAKDVVFPQLRFGFGVAF
jgi:hypothetical protein